MTKLELAHAEKLAMMRSGAQARREQYQPLHTAESEARLELDGARDALRCHKRLEHKEEN